MCTCCCDWVGGGGGAVDVAPCTPPPPPPPSLGEVDSPPTAVATAMDIKPLPGPLSLLSDNTFATVTTGRSEDEND